MHFELMATRDPDSPLTCEEMCEIIKYCRIHRVKHFSVGDFVLDMEPSIKKDDRIEIDTSMESRGVVIDSPAIAKEIAENESKVLKTAELAARELQSENLLIEDPLAREEMMLRGEINLD